MISDPNSLWSGRSLYELYEAAHTPWEWHEPLFERCKKHGLVGFSTPFDSSAVEFLASLDVPCYKIASYENVDLPLIRRVAATGRPVIISTGMATSAEIDDAVRAAREAGAGAVILMKCTSAYPADAAASNLMTIPHLAASTGCHVGLSDHTQGIGVAIAACGLGARLIEKHVTLRRADGGVDSAFSLEPEELATLVTESARAWRSLGSVSYGVTADEKASLQFRRSLYVVSDVPEGGIFTMENVRAIRPGFGLLPKYLERVIGRRATRPVSRGTPLSWELLM